MDEERKKKNPIRSIGTLPQKQDHYNEVYAKLDFPEGMTFGHRANLRKQCSRFLRYAYLVDFLSRTKDSAPGPDGLAYACWRGAAAQASSEGGVVGYPPAS